MIVSNSRGKPFEKSLWKYTEYYDFSYGEIIGFLNGYISGIVETLYGINLDQSMLEEIHQITENYVEEIKNRLLKQ